MILTVLRGILPLLKLAAAKTPTPIDDMIVSILEGLLNNPTLENVGGVKDHMATKGMLPKS